MSNLELKINRQVFLSALYKAQGVVDRKSTVNVLSHLYMETSGTGRLMLTGTDFDVVLNSEFDVNVIHSGKACVNGKSIFDVVKNTDDETVHLKLLDNNWMELKGGRSSFKLAGINPVDFPEVERPDEVSWLSFPRSVISDFIDKTSFSVSGDETRMNLNGVFMKVSPADNGLAQLTMVSTDGHRLSKVELPTEVKGYEGQTLEAIVHKKGVQELKRLLDGDELEIAIGFARGFILFKATDTVLTVRQIEDSYPDYERVIPPTSPIKLTIEKSRLVGAIKRMAILTSNKTYIVKMELGKDKMSFTSSTPEYGEGRDEVDVAYDGDTVTIGFNYSYLLDVFGALRGDMITLELSDEYGPTVISSPSEPGALFVVMPMRI
jgi:DNA polymerase-3 subunit beta